ncbi:MAG: hypothetical protein AAB383_02690 [Patescibacteria group bacterium]
MLSAIPQIQAFKVTPKDIAESFNSPEEDKGTRGWELHEDLYHCLADLGWEPSRYANERSGGRSADVNGYARSFKAASEWKQGHYPLPIKPVQVLYELGLFEGKPGEGFDVNLLKDFTHANPHFDLVTLLVATGFWSGSMIPANYVNKARTTLNFHLISRQLSPQQMDIFYPLVRQAAEKGFLSEKSAEGVKTGSAKSSLKGEVSRFMAKLFGIVGGKRGSDLQFPAYVMSALQTLEDPTNQHFQERTALAVQVLRDFIILGLSMRGSAQERSHRYLLTLSTHDTRELAVEQCKIFEKICRAIDFDPNFSFGTSEAQTNEGNPLFSSTVRLDGSYVQDMRQSAQSRVQQVVETAY